MKIEKTEEIWISAHEREQYFAGELSNERSLIIKKLLLKKLVLKQQQLEAAKNLMKHESSGQQPLDHHNTTGSCGQ